MLKKTPGLNPKETVLFLQKKNMQTDILLDVIQRLSLATNLETIMFIVQQAVRQLIKSDGVTFVLRENNQCYYADEDAISPLWKGKRFPMSICVSGWVMEHREPVVIQDIYTDPRVPSEAYRSTFVKSLAIVPIRTEEPMGAIGTYWAKNYRASEKQLSLLQALANSTSVAMQNIHLNLALEERQKLNSNQVEITNKLKETNKYLEFTLQELNSRNQEMMCLKELSASLQSCLYIEEACQLIAQYVKRLLPKVVGVLYLMHASKDYLESMINWGDVALSEKLIKVEDCLALSRGTVYKMLQPQHGVVCNHRVQANNRPYLCIPLYTQGEIIGLLYLEWMEDKAKKYFNLNENQELLAGMIAEQVALGISNIKLRETLRIQSFRDPLTNLYNRRYLEETLAREISRCERNSTSLALLMLDIDHFKQFNDQFGHEAGDVVIQSLAEVLVHFARKDDIPCRYGGEEFIFVLPDIDLEAMLQRVNALHEAVYRLNVKCGEITLPKITISVGLALFPCHAKTMNELIATADNALYQAKNTGRNKTVLYGHD